MRLPILALVLLPAIAVLASFLLPLNYFWGILFFYLAPGLYIAIRKKKGICKPILFSIITAIPFTILVDYIGTASNLWNVPYTLFPLFLNLLPIEDYIWMVSAIFTVIMISGIEEEIKSGKFLTKNMKGFIFGSGLALGIFFYLYIRYGQSSFVFSTPYLYIIVATIFFLLPVVALMWYLKRFSFRHIFTVGYFFLLTVLFESTAVYHSWWEFNGAYFLPPLTISGKALPLEELFFVGIVGACMAILLYRFLLQSRDGVK